ncbi:GDSL-type esterase/lipase family protein [Polaribacter sp. BAL334]|uniref:GDSL-type esterase/lipase family protein n=1 Tax=Polaribacter sp. BAL334 TaxID=1708178 RepID=UPI0018D23270|nr:GDSL-type esterase/lipase family protein [Polaribacter sp. BAL334]
MDIKNSINTDMRIDKYIILFIFSVIVSVSNAFSQNKTIYSEEIQTIKNLEKIYKPPTNPIVFVGSSSIRLWKNIEKKFDKYKVINKGLGGAQVKDIIHYADQLIFDYNPSQIVMYVGENDLKYPVFTADSIFQNTKKLITMIREKLPEVPIVYISIKPSPAGDLYKDKTIETNKLMKEYIENETNMTFVDIYNDMLTSNGGYRPELFASDKLHMKPEGYRIWYKALKPFLKF